MRAEEPLFQIEEVVSERVNIGFVNEKTADDQNGLVVRQRRIRKSSQIP